MPGNSIFISYRREDSAGEAGRLAEHLERRFGPDRVFFDIDGIAPGTDFVNELGRALDATAVMVVLIGKQWLSAANADGTRRLDDPNDFVHREIATAIARGSRVIPVLLHNVAMPSAAALPPALASLATRQAMSIQHEEFTDDARRLEEAIARLLGESATAAAAVPDLKRNRAALVIAGVAGALLIGFFIVRWQRDRATDNGSIANSDSAQQHRQLAVDDFMKIAMAQADRRQFSEALTTLDRAIATDGNAQRARTLREDLSMRWIRELKVAEGETFSAAMTKPLDVLDRAATTTSGSRHADILAHLGWATFLRWRDDRTNPTPLAAYQGALTADSTNPFANVMLGHWILSWEGGANALDRARRHFRMAADAGRAIEEVRHFQLAAFANDRSVESRLETVRVLNEMRTRSEKRPADVSAAWSLYYFALNGQSSLTVPHLVRVLPASDHLQTYQWAFADHAARDDGRGMQYRFYVARLRAEAGEVVPATDSLRALRGELARSPGMLRDAVDAALKELTSRP